MTLLYITYVPRVEQFSTRSLAVAVRLVPLDTERPAQALPACGIYTEQHSWPPSCLRYNLFYPKPILIIFGRAVATGYIGIYPPNQSTLNFLCGCFVSKQWLVNIYTHPNQIPGYASDIWQICCQRTLQRKSAHLLNVIVSSQVPA